MACAFVQSGGKQHRVEAGERIRVEKLKAAPGETVLLKPVLAIVDEQGGVHFGQPHLDGSSVTASVVQHGKADRIRIAKVRRRKHSRRRMGHRQSFTELQIISVNLSGEADAENTSIEDTNAQTAEET